MNGLKIINVECHQVVDMQPGTYTFSCTVKPVGTSLTFRVGSTNFVISNLQAGVLQKDVKRTFTIDGAETKFYPSRTIGDELFNLMLEEGTNASTPQPNPLDISESAREVGIQIKQEMVLLYAKKEDVTGEIESKIQVATDAIDLSIGQIESDLLSTGINIQNKKIEVTADKFTIKSNTGVPYAAFGLKDGSPILKSEFIDAENLTARRLISPFVEVGVSDFQSTLSNRHNVRIMDPGVSPVTYPWQTVYLPGGIEHDGLNIKIYAPYGAVKRLKIKPTSGGLIFTDEPIGAYTQLKLSYNTRARIHLSSSWDVANNVLDWHMTSYSSYMISSGPQNTGKRIPTVFKPGDILFSASIASNGAISSINSNWSKAITCSWSSSTGYMVTIPWHSYFNTSGGISVPEIPISKFSIIATSESGALRRTMYYTYNNTSYQRTQIYVVVATATSGTPSQSAFNIVVKANEYIVQDPYLEELVD